MIQREWLARAIGRLPLEADVDVRGLVDAAIAEGVGALLADSPAAEWLGAAERDRLTEYVRADTARQAAVDVELQHVLEALSREGVAPLLLKGAHLAHAVYRRPWLRPRADTDLLIAAADRDRIARALESCGYMPAHHVRGRIILGQFHFERIDRGGIAHYLDVHWRVAAPLLIERVLPARLFFPTARALPAQGPHARVPDLPHALLLACVHLVAHHRSNPLLVWLYDLRLLAEALDEPNRDVFVDLTYRLGCCAIARHALDASRRVFESTALDDLAARMAAPPSRREPSAALLRVTRPAGALWMDLRTADWRDRATLLREHLLPDRQYMAAGRGLLPMAYAIRAARGARRWLTGNW